ncbi:MAG: caspase family protein [Deltaproteobacteria bacterium]|nr:caspase family protein [Deltaproteobacteria bacterium]
MARPLLIAAAIAGSLGTAHADPIAAHALVVGSNAAGPGQTELRYAEDDARRVGALLTELGGYVPASVDIVTRPTPAILRDRLAKLGQRVAADVAAGKQTRVFFYYSGHARATAIDLGFEALPLAELRQTLFSANATLTVVVLDACQSGAFSRVKGAQPTADFSYNSRHQLDAKGVAVLASSTGSELSQESEQLKSSYFTHHLLVGMRGAGDANSDGQVTVDEAYRYAYHQTLLATSVTAVGGQHVTLEVDLKGHGEVALSYPRAATASIELPANLEGKTLVQLKKARTVVAETHKAKGKAVRIAVAPGEYEVLVRQGDRMLRCPVVAPGHVELGRCANEAYLDGTRKGGTALRPQWWEIDVSAMLGGNYRDGFEQRLLDFGYREDGGPRGNLGLSVKRFWVMGRYSIGGFVGIEHVNGPGWARETEREPLEFNWTSTTIGPGLSGHVHLTPRIAFNVDTTVGLGIGRTRFSDQDAAVTTETHFGFVVGGGAGLAFEELFGTHAELKLACKLMTGAVIRNDIGDSLDPGGLFCGLGVGYQYGAKR